MTDEQAIALLALTMMQRDYRRRPDAVLAKAVRYVPTARLLLESAKQDAPLSGGSGGEDG